MLQRGASNQRVLRDRDRDVYLEHGVAHFHATYAGATVVIAIETSEVIAGSVPARALRLVQEWTELHREELMHNWERARAQAPLERIEPLA
jgi:Domain of unknown function (DUF4160)